MAYDPATLAMGDVVLVERGPRDLLGWLIDVATDSPFCHAALVGDGCLIEALWTVTRSPLGKYAAAGWAYRPVSALVGPVARQQAATWATARLGRRYGVGEMLADAGRDVLHLPLWPRAAPRRFTCSGLVAAAYAAAGTKLTHAPWPSPMDLAESPLLLGPRPWEE